MHTLRLLCECNELVSSGTITLPRLERDFLVRVCIGSFSMEKVIAMAKELMAECKASKKNCVPPEGVDRLAVSMLVADCYRRAWERTD
jgi:hypothetical protein